MPRLTVRVIGTKPGTNTESVLAKMELQEYDPGRIGPLVSDSLQVAVRAVGGSGPSALRGWDAEVSVAVTDLDGLRPSLHIDGEALGRLAAAGASFDFDPYQ